MAKKSHKKLRTHGRKLILTIFAILAVPVMFYLVYWDRVYPGVVVAGISVSGLEVDKVAETLSTSVKNPERILIGEAPQEFAIPTDTIDFSYEFGKSAERAYKLGRSGNILFDVQNIARAIVRKTNLPLAVKLNEEKMTSHIAAIAGAVETEPVYPKATIVSKEVVIEEGREGVKLDKLALRARIGEALATKSSERVLIPKLIVDPRLNEDEKKAYQERAEKLLGKSLNVNFEFLTFSYKQAELLNWLNPKGGLDEEKINEIAGVIANDVNRDAQNPTFSFESGKVREFAPAKEGVKTDMVKLRELIAESVDGLEKAKEKELSILVPVTKTPSKVQTADVNDLGIKELIGRGTSRYRGSISSRIHNVALAASRINGVLIAPGEVFSFNTALGDVSKFTGFKEAYIIQDGKTVLGDGGGVCQVSTTLFRAALNAGLPIVERRAHSYRVGYYEQDSGPGIDATVYSPTTDLKIKNDTPAHILIQAQADSRNLSLVFELYGTSDGRVATISKPLVSGTTPPPPDLFIDDPTLPLGVVKQIDYKAWGAKASFNYEVSRDGERLIKTTFYSNYRAWQAKFLRGTRPI